jgi:hypothetical protein
MPLLKGKKNVGKYDEPQAGEWVQPVREDYKLRCCDCGLVHRIDFRIKEGHIQFRAFLDNRATGQSRRHRRNNNG